jgi:ribosome-binding protein aMBF1 (putative translation factor)
MSDMTPAEFVAAREALGWPRTQIARFLNCNEKSIRQMEAAQRSIPPAVAGWLRRALRWLENNPPPDDWRVR